MGCRYAPQITFDLGQEIGGYSARLVFALAIYDKITEGALLDSRHVAAPVASTPTGDVGAIRRHPAEDRLRRGRPAGAFPGPEANCVDLAGLRTDLTLIKIATLQDAIEAMLTLDRPDGTAQVPHCP